MTALVSARAGENALIFYLPPPASAADPQKLHALATALDGLAGVIERIPAYRSLLVEFDPAQLSAATLIDFLAGIDIHQTSSAGKCVEIPICYHPDLAPDLEPLAAKNGISAATLAEWHCGREYDVYCIGFIPGFPFLGYIDDRISAPRHQTPRPHVAAGSVGLAGRQTGIYPIASPGGWQIIGRTPLKLYDPAAGIFSLVAAGDKVRFTPISYPEFLAWQEKSNV